MASEDKPKLRLHKKLKIPYCKEHGNLVFNDSKERLAVGRLENDAFVELDDTTIALCEQYGEQYDKSLVTEEVEEEEAPAEEKEKEEDDEKDESVEVSDTEELPVKVEKMEKKVEKTTEKTTEKPVEKTTEKTTEKSSEKSTEKTEKVVEKSTGGPEFEPARKTVLKILSDLEASTQTKISSMEKSHEKALKDLEKKLEEASVALQKEQTAHTETKKKLKGMAELLSGSL